MICIVSETKGKKKGGKKERSHFVAMYVSHCVAAQFVCRCAQQRSNFLIKLTDCMMPFEILDSRAKGDNYCSQMKKKKKGKNVLELYSFTSSMNGLKTITRKNILY